MANFCLITDSTSDLLDGLIVRYPVKELRRGYQIDIVPAILYAGADGFRDGEDITRAEYIIR